MDLTSQAENSKLAELHSECRRRQLNLQQKMKQHGTHLFLLTQNIDLYYFTGSMQTGYLAIPAEGDAIFYVRRSVIRAESESFSKVKPLGSFRNFGNTLRNDFPHIFNKGSQNEKETQIALEFDVLPTQMYLRLQNILPGIQWVDGSLWVRELRMIKSPFEIKYIKQAAAIVDEAIEQALTLLKPGMTELELISEIEHVMRLQGDQGIIRMRAYNSELVTGLVARGESAAQPTYFDGPAGGQGLSSAFPQGPSRAQISRNEPIIIDIGCNFEGYLIDQTRTAVIGELADDLRKAYEVSEQIIRLAETMLKPGTTCEQLYLLALEQAEAAGLSDHFMGFGEDQVKFLGHGIGLEMDELPVLAKGFKYQLEPGMVIAIEPKFTFPGRGVVGIENSYLIKEDGFEKLTVTREGIISV